MPSNFDQETLCFKCANAYKKCSWSAAFIPVEGWTATPTIKRMGKKEKEVPSYLVTECPLFRADSQRNIETIHDDAIKPFLYAMLLSLVHDYADDYIKYTSNPNADHANDYRRSMSETERFVEGPLFEDMVDVLELMVNGPKLLKLIRSDPHGVLERIKADPDNFRGKQAEEHEEVKHRRNCRKEI